MTYSLREQQGEREHLTADLKYTDAGRQVYSGGGIEPDMFMAGPIEGFDPTSAGRSLFARQTFPRYARKYSALGDTRISGQGRNRISVDRNFEVTDGMVADFGEFISTERISIDTDALWEDEAFVRAMIRYYIDLDLFGVVDARRHLVEVDPQATFALSLFTDAAAFRQLPWARQSIEQ